MGDVVRFGGDTIVPHDPDYILEAAKGQSLADVVVIGMHDPDNPSLWLSSSTSDVERVVYLLERAKRQFLDTVFPKA